MKRRFIPRARRRAPIGPSRGVRRTPPAQYGTAHGCVFISPAIAKAEHEIVLAAFEAHIERGGAPDAHGYLTSTVETPRGVIVITTNTRDRQTFAFYDWED